MSERRRDIRFEIQYILSLTLVVFGLISTSGIRAGMNEWVGYLVIFSLALHLSIFNIVYAFSSETGLTVDMAKTLERWSRPTLLAIGGLFVVFILHTTIGVIYLHLSRTYGSISTMGEILIMYIGPISLVSIMGYSVKRRGVDPISSFEGINIKVVPEFLRVFPAPGDSKALLVKVENNGDESFDYDLDINIPEVVTLHKSGEEITGHYSNDGVVEPGRADRYSFDLSHISEEHSADELTVTVDADGASHTTDVELELAV